MEMIPSLMPGNTLTPKQPSNFKTRVYTPAQYFDKMALEQSTAERKDVTINALKKVRQIQERQRIEFCKYVFFTTSAFALSCAVWYFYTDSPSS